MARQIEPRLGEPRLAILDRHVAELEVRLALLAEAVRVLIRELEARPATDRCGPAVQRARELVLESERRR